MNQGNNFWGGGCGVDRDSGSSHSSNIHNRECLVCMGYVDTGDGIETDFGVSEKQKNR